MGDIVQDEIRRTGQQMGIQDMRLLMHWEAVVGRKYSRVSYPMKISRGVLRIGAHSSFATELVHIRPVIVEAVNRHLGREAITDVSIASHNYTLLPPSEPAPPTPDPVPPESLDPPPLEGFSSPELARSGARLIAAVERREAWEGSREGQNPDMAP